MLMIREKFSYRIIHLNQKALSLHDHKGNVSLSHAVSSQWALPVTAGIWWQKQNVHKLYSLKLYKTNSSRERNGLLWLVKEYDLIILHWLNTQNCFILRWLKQNLSIIQIPDIKYLKWDKLNYYYYYFFLQSSPRILSTS